MGAAVEARRRACVRAKGRRACARGKREGARARDALLWHQEERLLGPAGHRLLACDDARCALLRNVRLMKGIHGDEGGQEAATCAAQHRHAARRCGKVRVWRRVVHGGRVQV